MGRSGRQGLLGIHMNLRRGECGRRLALDGRPTRNAPPQPRSTFRCRAATATSSSRTGRRLSATPCSTHPSRSRPDARPRHRRLLQDLTRLRRAGSHRVTSAGEHVLDNIIAVLADRHRGLRPPARTGAGCLRGRPPTAGHLPPVPVPVGFTAFPGEIWRRTAQLGRGVLPAPQRTSTTAERGGGGGGGGGHFAALGEEPRHLRGGGACCSDRFADPRNHSVTDTTKESFDMTMTIDAPAAIHLFHRDPAGGAR